MSSNGQETFARLNAQMTEPGRQLVASRAPLGRRFNYKTFNLYVGLQYEATRFVGRLNAASKWGAEQGHVARQRFRITIYHGSGILPGRPWQSLQYLNKR